MKKLLTMILSVMLLVVAVFGSACSPELEKGKVNIKYYNKGKEIVSAMLAGSETIGLVPEPAATNLETKYLEQKGAPLYRLDLQELYDKDAKAYPQAVLMVKKSVLGANPNLVSLLQTKITESASWIKQNQAIAVNAINSNGGVDLNAQTLTENAIDGCKIYWQSALDAKTSVKKYINKIIDIDSTKASAVSDDFFYTSAVETGSQKEVYTFMAPDGAPALAIAKLIYDNDNLGTGKTVDYSVLSSTLVMPNLSSGSADIIVAPVNLASKLYKANGNEYVMVAAITHGNFYILSTTEISIKDLKGKQVAVPNQGAVPDWTFKMVLYKNNLTNVTVE
ncbi:MAG: hypothetical protein E7372_02330 [Clostridiales bacterium]|nr:hypothetical protein [Clostridiales bacterium]